MFNAMKMVNQKYLQGANMLVEPENEQVSNSVPNSKPNINTQGMYNGYGNSGQVLFPTQAVKMNQGANTQTQNMVNPINMLQGTQATDNIVPQNDSTQATDNTNNNDSTDSKNKAPGGFNASAAFGGGPLTMVGTGFGIVNGILGNRQKNEELRRREAEVEQAIVQNASEREKINMMNPNANFRTKMGMIQDSQSQMMQQASNVGGANVANSGLGGDVGSAKIASMKASAPIAQVNSQFGQQMAGAVDQKTQEENQQIGQLANNTGQRAQLSQMTDYINTEKNKNPIDGILSSALTGAVGFNILDTMRNKKKTDNDTPTNKAGK